MREKLLFVCGLLVTLTFAQAQQGSINPTQPGSIYTPIPMTQALRPLSPGTVGQNLGARATNTLNASAQPEPNAAAAETATPRPGGVVIPEEASRHIWKIRPQFSVGVTFDDNIYISHTNRVSDVIWSVSGGLSYELGDYRTLRENYLIAQWVGTGYLYTENPAQNAFNQSAVLLGQYRWEKLTGILESRYQYLTGPDRQVGNFVTRHIFSNALRFVYDYSDKTTLNAEFVQNTQLFESYLNQYEYKAKVGAAYQIFPKIKVGVEGVGGILDVEDSPLQVYEQARLTGRYDLTGKLTFIFSGGLEFRQIQSNERLRVNPVFSLGFQYQPFVDTVVSLTGYRNVFGSQSFRAQDYTATGLELSIQQSLFERFTLGLGVGYENDSYYGTTATTGTDRIDNFYFVRPSIRYKFVDWLSGGIFYEFRNNVSTSTVNEFYENRAGIDFACQF